ncbi:hypothetical protein [Thiomicrorhabdus indica]|uniref:hypothetical protein n=1 Tax=Thiomicrorhabdus indica TaxID=2267253 RepID=UPI00102DF2B2|nr:hypothetical protein [Thiomicrorhabdus indica]
MDFSVFESVSGSQAVFYAAFGALFVGIILWRIASSLNESYKRMNDGDIEIDEWFVFFIKLFGLFAFVAAFLIAAGYSN